MNQRWRNPFITTSPPLSTDFILLTFPTSLLIKTAHLSFSRSKNTFWVERSTMDMSKIARFVLKSENSRQWLWVHWWLCCVSGLEIKLKHLINVLYSIENIERKCCCAFWFTAYAFQKMCYSSNFPFYFKTWRDYAYLVVIILVRTQILRKINISYPLIHTRACTYQGIRNVNFSENFAYVLNGWPP